MTLILHNIRSTHNVGSIFRSAEGFGVDHIVISGYTPYPNKTGDSRLPHIANKLDAQIHKTALGAEKMVTFEQHAELDDWLTKNSESTTPLPIIGLEQNDNSVAIGSFIPPSRFALLLGEEVAGIDNKYIRACSHIVEIPMRGKKESFNVSVAVGVALYALTSA